MTIPRDRVEIVLDDASRLAVRADELVEVLDRLVANPVGGAPDADALRHASELARQQRKSTQRLLARFADGTADAAARERARTRVVVADGDGGVRGLVAEVLRAAGLTVRTAENGLEALIAALEFRPDAIVMDVVRMPVLSGLEATRLIRAALRGHAVKVIAYTSDVSLAEALPKSWLDAIVAKPAPPDAVLAAIRDVVGVP